MKTRFILVAVLIATLLLVGCSSAASAEESTNDLHYDRFYMIFPEINIRAEPDKPGKIDTIYAGQEVELISTEDIWATFKYTKDGEERTGCTWAGVIAPAVRIHLLEEEYIFHKPIYDRTELGLLSTWREPIDPDLLILWEERDENGELWYYVVILDSCRSGYMRGSAKFEIVE